MNSTHLHNRFATRERDSFALINECINIALMTWTGDIHSRISSDYTNLLKSGS